MTLTQLFDAHRTRDPTQTLQLRKSFRATAKLRLRQLRAAMRMAVVDQNVLGFAGSAVISFHPTDVRLNAFSGWLAATGAQFLLGSDWARPFIERAWRVGAQKAMRETGGGPGDDLSAGIVELARIEIQGILDATVQQVSREAAGIIARGTPRFRALRRLFRVFDKVAQPRLVVMADVMVVKAVNAAKLQVYRSAGIKRVGIDAEVLPASTMRDALTLDRKRALTAEEELQAPSRARLQRMYEETEVGVLTSNDDRVCERCEDFAAGAPYAIDEVLDVLPMHPRCRCAVYPWEDLRFRGEDSVEDYYDPEQPRDPKGSPTGGQWTKAGGGGGYEFVSPNVGQGGLAEATKELKSERQRALQTASHEVDNALSIEGVRHDAIGAWSDGAENTIVTTVGGNESWDKIKVSAAMKGHLADQKAVLVFKQNEEGSAALYRMHTPESDVQKLHENLIKDGLAFHTIVPHTEGGGADVIVADLNGSAHDAMAKAAERYNADVTYEIGQAEFIGTQKQDGSDREQRDDARRAYEEVIQQSSVQGSQEVWARLRHSWGETLGVAVEKPSAAEPWGAEQGVVASRNITSKKSSFEGYARPDVEAMKESLKNFEHDVGLFSNTDAYPNFRPDELKGSTDERVHTIVEHMKSNLHFMYEHASAAVKASGMRWYERAHDIAVTSGKRYGIDERSASGVIATLSPQKDWNQNIYLANAVMEINHSQQNHTWDEKMEAKAYGAPGVKAIWKPKDRELVDVVKGKKLNELTDPAEKAVWIRTYDEAHSNRQYRNFDTGELVMRKGKKKGTLEPAQAAWQSIPAIASAVECLDSKGDLKVISAALGMKHKVRSFYNNIIAPRAPNGDVTVDTHAVGVVFISPFSGKDTAVMQALATAPQRPAGPRGKDWKPPPGWEAASQSAVTGIKGTYPIYAEAYREVATELGILPQQLQAITWQAKREMFNILPGAKLEVRQEWVKYHNKEQNLEQTQQNVLTITRNATKTDEDEDE
jgi:hypothetical protein